MARSYEGPGSSKTRRQEEDARRMAFRRAIESRTDERRLLAEIVDFPELHTLQVAAMTTGRSVQLGY
jgi:hypothetical protein